MDDSQKLFFSVLNLVDSIAARLSLQRSASIPFTSKKSWYQTVA